MVFIPETLKEEAIKRDNFQCRKCGFLGSKSNLEVRHILSRAEGGKNELDNLVALCSICNTHAPSSKEELLAYLDEKIDSDLLNTFRKFSSSKKLKDSMAGAAKQGNAITRAPLGYRIENKVLVKDEEQSLKVRKIFLDFINNNLSLNQLAKNNNLSVNGIKKILKNRTYIGYITFAGQSAQGKHEPIIDSQMFEIVSRKLEK